MSNSEQRLVADDDELWTLLAQSEKLLSGLTRAAENSAQDDDQPWQFPAPLADRAAVEALGRVWDSLAEHLTPPERQDNPTGATLHAPDGRDEHTPLRLVTIPQADLTVLEAAVQVCSHATIRNPLLPEETTGQVADLRGALDQIELDPGPMPREPLRGAAALGPLARLVALLDLTPNADTQLLASMISEPGDVVLTDEAEAAYQRVITRINALISDGDPLRRFLY
jgi:hypothetical protein